MLTLCVVVATRLMAIFTLINEIKTIKKDKKSCFECGFENLSEKKITFSTNFTILIVIFLIFDVEISILIPFLIINKNNQRKIMLVSSIFIIGLMALTLKEWKQGSLEWTK